MFNQKKGIKRWLFKLFFGKVLEKKAFDMVINDAIDIMSINLVGSKDELDDISSIQYISQIKKLFFNSPFLLTLAMDDRQNVMNSSPVWQKQLGWSKHDLLSIKLLDLVHPEDYDRTISAYTDIENMEEGGLFYNRYKCKFNTSWSFEDSKEEYVWVGWQMNIPYSNNDKYRMAIGKVISKHDPLFELLQKNYDTNKKEISIKS